MTDLINAVVVTKVASRCQDSVTNLMTDTDIRALVNSAIISYNTETPLRSQPEEFGRVTHSTELEDAVIHLLKAYVRGQLPHHMEAAIGYTANPDDEVEVEPEGEAVEPTPVSSEPTPEPAPVYSEPTPAPAPVTSTEPFSSYY